jgi:hypothetical protein
MKFTLDTIQSFCSFYYPLFEYHNQEAGERWQRRSNMILHMKALMEELKIGFQLPRQEITVTGIPLLDVPRTSN